MRLREVLALRPGGSAEEGPHVRGGSELRLMNVSKILAQGGSICRVLRGSEVLGGAQCLRALREKVGPLKKDLT